MDMNLSNSIDMKRLTEFGAGYEKSYHCKNKNHCGEPELGFWAISYNKDTATLEGVEL